jgi:hypothetical protein
MPSEAVGEAKTVTIETKGVVPKFVFDWKIRDFLLWAISKEVGSSEFSPNVSFFSEEAKKTFTFGLTVKPRGSNAYTEDMVGIFLQSRNEVF